MNDLSLFLLNTRLTDLCSSWTYGWVISFSLRNTADRLLLLLHMCQTALFSSWTHGWPISIPLEHTAGVISVPPRHMADRLLFLFPHGFNWSLFSWTHGWLISVLPRNIADWSLFLLDIYCWLIPPGHMADGSLFLLVKWMFLLDIWLTYLCPYWTNGWLISVPIAHIADLSLFLETYAVKDLSSSWRESAPRERLTISSDL